jgi:hypothetical protein
LLGIDVARVDLGHHVVRPHEHCVQKWSRQNPEISAAGEH